MLSDESLTKISFVITIVGVIALYFIVQTTEPNLTPLKDISHDMVGNYVKVVGAVKSISWHESGHLFITLRDEYDEIKVVMFSKEAKKFAELKEIKKDEQITIIGKIDEYENELEVVAEKIEILK